MKLLIIFEFIEGEGELILFFEANENFDGLDSDFGGHPLSRAVVNVEEVDEVLQVLLQMGDQVLLGDL